MKPNTKRCAAEDVLLRTFCSFPAQGLGGWCAAAMGNVVNIQCCQYQFSVPLWMCRGYGGKLAIGNIGNGNTFTLETLAIRSNPVGDTKKGEEAS